jgi:hypothetical protein
VVEYPAEFGAWLARSANGWHHHYWSECCPPKRSKSSTSAGESVQEHRKEGEKDEIKWDHWRGRKGKHLTWRLKEITVKERSITLFSKPSFQYHIRCSGKVQSKKVIKNSTAWTQSPKAAEIITLNNNTAIRRELSKACTQY